jgi:hypothetical protein
MIRAKLAAFVVVLAAAFGAGAALGAIAGPIDVGGDPPTHQQHGADPDEHR